MRYFWWWWLLCNSQIKPNHSYTCTSGGSRGGGGGAPGVKYVIFSACGALTTIFKASEKNLAAPSPPKFFFWIRPWHVQCKSQREFRQLKQLWNISMKLQYLNLLANSQSPGQAPRSGSCTCAQSRPPAHLRPTRLPVEPEPAAALAHWWSRRRSVYHYKRAFNVLRSCRRATSADNRCCRCCRAFILWSAHVVAQCNVVDCCMEQNSWTATWDTIRRRANELWTFNTYKNLVGILFALTELHIRNHSQEHRQDRETKDLPILVIFSISSVQKIVTQKLLVVV